MSFDRTTVKKPEDLIPDGELEDSSLADKYACHNFKNPTAIKCLDGRTRRHAETEEIFQYLFEIKDNGYHITNDWNYFIRPAFLCEDIDPPKDIGQDGIDYNGSDAHSQHVSEKWQKAIEKFKKISSSLDFESSSEIDSIRNKLLCTSYARDSKDVYPLDNLIFSRPIPFDYRKHFHFWYKSTFENSIFLNYVYLGFSYFTGGINFSNTYFFDKICMDNTIFTDKSTGANFENAIFFKDVEWIYTIFKNVNFNNTIFYDTVYFSDKYKTPSDISSFSNTDFSNATFHKEIYFGHCKFDNVSFEKAIFKKEAYFEGSDFKAKNNFNYCQFEGERETSFKKCTFIEELKCNYSIFKNDVRFEEAIFKEGATLMKCIFEKTANFEKIKYSEKINFSNSTFEDKLYLYGSQALTEQSKLNLNGITAKDIYFSPPENKNETPKIVTYTVDIQGSDIKGTIFAKDFCNKEKLKLNGTNLRSLLLFPSNTTSTTDFLGEIPDLRGIKLDGEIRFNDINWNIKVTKENALDPAQRWEALQHLCEKQGQYRHELDFFARAMDARQLAEKSWSKKFIVGLYKIFSDYGRSITIPFYFLILTFLVFALIYTIFLVYFCPEGLVDSYPKSLILSAKNTFPFLPDDVFSRQHFKNGFYASYKDNYGLYSFIRTINVILGLIFTFLTGLGIRNWLRLR